MKIFLDLDSVITDFDKQMAELLDRPLKRGWNFGNDPAIWDKLAKAGTSYWSTMDWMPDGKQLWAAVKKYHPTILSAPTKEQSSIDGKKEWLKKHLPNIPYILESEKQIYADEDSILIDDRIKNIRKWREKGGIGILHKNAEDTISQLEKIMSSKKASENKHSVNRVLLSYLRNDI